MNAKDLELTPEEIEKVKDDYLIAEHEYYSWDTVIKQSARAATLKAVKKIVGDWADVYEALSKQRGAVDWKTNSIDAAKYIYESLESLIKELEK